MAGSLQRRLERGPVALLLGVVGVFGVVVGVLGSRGLVTAFDRDLEARAWTVVATLGSEPEALSRSAIEASGDGTVFDGTEFDNTEFDNTVFEVWDGTGVSLARSRSLGSTSLARLLPDGSAHGPRFYDQELPEDGRGRAVQLEISIPDVAAGRGAPALAVVLRSRETLDRRLTVFWGALATTLVVGLVILVLATRSLVHRGLAPVTELARDLDRIDFDPSVGRLGPDLTTKERPAELRPVADGLGRLLDHLDRTLERERRWSNDVAHELRTPIAELRTLAEVARRGPTGGARDDFFVDVRDIALQMEGIVTQLLQMARTESGLDPVAWETLSWGEAFDAAWAPFADKARQRDLDLDLDLEIPDDLLFESDPIKLRLVLSNLLGNAVAHSPEGSTLSCRASKEGSWLEIANPAPELRPEDLSTLFDRFWRKDPARTGSLHAGLGLSLVRALADRLGLAIGARLEQGHLVIRLTPGGGASETGNRPPDRLAEATG